MSDNWYTHTTHPYDDQEAIAEVAARLPLQTVIDGVKRGSIESIILLSAKVKDDYAAHASIILDAVLPHLNQPPGWVHALHTTSAFMAMNVLVEVFKWYKNHPMPNPGSLITALRIQENLHNFVYWSRRLLRGCNMNPDAPLFLDGYDTIGQFLFTLFQVIPGDTLGMLAKDPIVLGVAVDLSTRLFKGFPIIYPRGRHPDPLLDQPDSPSAVLLILARENPKGLVEVVINETVCAAETFVKRIVQRMRCYHCLSSIKRFTHFPQDVSERLNVHYILALTLQLMECDSRMHNLFMEAKVPEVYTSAVAKQLRIAAQFPDPDGRANYLLDFAVAPIRWWQMVESGGVLARAEEMAEEGMYSLIGSLLPYSRVTMAQSEFKDRDYTIGHALSAILPYSLYPNVLLKSAAAMEKFILPHIGTLPSESPYRGLLPSLLLYLRHYGKFLPREQQEPLCDNLNHSNTRLANAYDPHHVEKVCAGCHSVAYCSRQCQKEDWTTFHRDECQAMRGGYFERKASNRWYSYSYRRFHTSVLRYAFESVEVVTTILGPVGAGSLIWQSYSPRKVNNQVEPLRALNRLGLCCTDLEPWVGREAPLVPEYLRPRFDAFLRAFLASFEVPEYMPGSLRLVERVTPLGGEDVTLLLILRQAHPRWKANVSGRQLLETVRKFTFREPRSKSIYEIVGSFTFTGPCRERLNLGTVVP